LPECLKHGIFISFHQDTDIVEKEIITNDFYEEIPFGLNDTIDYLETFLGEAIDDDILPIIEGRPLEESVEFPNKICS
jgi:hypothetical protein